MTSKVDTEPYKESSLSRIASVEGAGPKYLAISAALPLGKLNYTLLEDFLLVAGLHTLNFKGLLVIGGFSLGKGRIFATEYGQVRDGQSPQCKDIMPTLDCI